MSPSDTDNRIIKELLIHITTDYYKFTLISPITVRLEYMILIFILDPVSTSLVL